MASYQWAISLCIICKEYDAGVIVSCEIYKYNMSMNYGAFYFILSRFLNVLHARGVHYHSQAFIFLWIRCTTTESPPVIMSPCMFIRIIRTPYRFIPWPLWPMLDISLNGRQSGQGKLEPMAPGLSHTHSDTVYNNQHSHILYFKTF